MTNYIVRRATWFLFSRAFQNFTMDIDVDEREGYREREAALNDLKRRCDLEAGLRITGQDLRRVAGYKQPNTLYRWLNRGELNERFRNAIALSTQEFIAKALLFRPDRKKRSSWAS
jgi:hypothetical protein